MRQRSRRRRREGALGDPRWLLLAAGLHGVPMLASLGTPRAAQARRMRPVELVLTPAPPPPKPATPPPAADEAAPKAAAPKAAKPRRTRRAAPKRAAKPAPAPTPTPAEPPRRRVVGLSMGSTVRGGGDAYAVGNTRMGATERVAAAPSAAPTPTPPPAPKPLNRRVRGARTDLDAADIERPRRRARVEPEYPPDLRARGVEADVVVQVELTTEGTVARARILRRAAHRAFDEAALEAARRERFEPARRDGAPIPFTLSFTYRFRTSA